MRVFYQRAGQQAVATFSPQVRRQALLRLKSTEFISGDLSQIKKGSQIVQRTIWETDTAIAVSFGLPHEQLV